jgi:hypothetical protein
VTQRDSSASSSLSFCMPESGCAEINAEATPFLVVHGSPEKVLVVDEYVNKIVLQRTVGWRAPSLAPGESNRPFFFLLILA